MAVLLICKFNWQVLNLRSISKNFLINFIKQNSSNNNMKLQSSYYAATNCMISEQIFKEI